MAYFPFYIDISDKVFLVVGGGEVAFRKIQVLSQFDARIIVLAPDICERIFAIKNEKIILKKRKFLDDDIGEAEFIIAATDDEVLNSHISDLSRKNKKLVNVVDVKEECSFIFPSILKNGELVVAVSTGGSSPAMAAKIKSDIQESIPEYYGAMLEALGEQRAYLKREVSSPENRKKAYNELISFADLNEGKITKEEIKRVILKYKDEKETALDEWQQDKNRNKGKQACTCPNGFGG